MKPVIQQDKTGCGIASVAALAGIQYAQVKAQASKLGIPIDDPKLWSDTEYVRALLAKFKIAASEKEQKFISWQNLPDLALLAIKWHKENNQAFWHWTVFVRDSKSSYILDPKQGLKQNKRSDFGRVKPKWFIEVYQ